MHILIYLIGICFGCYYYVNAEVFTALTEIEKSAKMETHLAGYLLEYVKHEKKRLSEIQQLANDMLINRQDSISSRLGHPVAAFILIKRLVSDWKQLVVEDSKVNLDNLLADVDKLKLPDQEDFSGATEALLRLQDTYSLPTAWMAAGQLQSGAPAFPISQQLSAMDCYYLGRYSYINLNYYTSVLWMSETLDRLRLSTNCSQTVFKDSILAAKALDHLSYSQFKQGHIQEALAFTNELLFLEPKHERARNNKEHYLALLEKNKQSSGSLRGDNGKVEDAEGLLYNTPHRTGWYASDEFKLYKKLCREAPPSSNPELLCNYYTPHPYYSLAPVKQEVVSLEPRLVMWHDIIHPVEIDRIIELATPKLARATVQDPVTSQLVFAKYRISKSAWLFNNLDQLTKIIDQRIDFLTGLTIETAEELQVVNYGLGGHYEPHYDFARKREPNAFEKRLGNRIATLLFYLSDVEAGGATVFTELGARIEPRKGSAAFWHNLRRNGQGILRTRHAACPVLKGTKWVMNKWFHERGQEFRRPCAMDPAI